ncbi:hypothetical protein HAX54_032649 [Datura stramonium]|uniref:Uncharacterized protein n=1 Tax=Datura stramonium TaxID=4076 RepID=A0ABS8VB32_DATST|nr:hypothetical protein [Datura stramonium]
MAPTQTQSRFGARPPHVLPTRGKPKAECAKSLGCKIYEHLEISETGLPTVKDSETSILVSAKLIFDKYKHMANSESAPPPSASKVRIDKVRGDMNEIIGIDSFMSSENEFNAYLNLELESITDEVKQLISSF